MCLLAGLKQTNDRGKWPKPIPAPLGDSPARKLGKELVDNVQQARLIQRSSFSFKGTANLRISRCTPMAHPPKTSEGGGALCDYHPRRQGSLLGLNLSLKMEMEWGCGSVGLGHPTGTLPTHVRFPGAARDFSVRVDFQCGLSCGVRTPPCAIACIYICAHVKNCVAHVRVRWIMETLKRSACP